MPPFQPCRDLNGLYRVEHFSTFDSFFNASTNVSMLWRMLWVSFLIETLKYSFNVTSLERMFQTIFCSFSLYTFRVGMKFKFLLRSLYSLFVKNIILTIFVYGSNWYLINSSIQFDGWSCAQYFYFFPTCFSVLRTIDPFFKPSRSFRSIGICFWFSWLFSMFFLLVCFV